MLHTLAHQSTMQELDFLNPVLDQRILFARASTRTYYGSDGLLHTAANDVWPLEYDPVTLQLLGRSIWEQRTNLVPFSQQAGGSLFGITQTDNAAVAPDGTTTMVLQTNNGAGGQHWRQDAGHWPSATTQTTYSIFAKKGTANYIHIFLSKNNAWAQFDLTTGALVFSSAGTATNFSAAMIRALPGGLFRFAVTASNNAGAVENTRVYFLDVPQNVGAPAETSSSTGYWWGEQIEVGSFATPYIPTAGATVTRSRDIPDLSTLDSVRFNQAAGQSVYLEYLYSNGNNYSLMQIHDGDATLDTDWLIYSNNNPDQFLARMYSASSAGNHFGGAFASNRNAVNKGVVAADQTGTGGSLNAGVPKSAINCIPPNSALVGARLGQTFGGSSCLNGWLRKVRFIPAKLTTGEQQAITA